MVAKRSGNDATWLTRSQVAKLLGIHVSRVRQLEGSALHPVKDERGVHLFTRAEVDELARRRGRAPANDGEVTARVFEMFRDRRSLVEIVIETRLEPERVQKLYEQYQTPLGGRARVEREERERAADDEALRRWEEARRTRRSS